jgi:hypothetical protein
MSRENLELGIERALQISVKAKVLGQALLLAALLWITFNLERPEGSELVEIAQ